MLANPVKAQDSWRVAVDEVRDELRRGPGAWKPTEVLGFALAPMRKILSMGVTSSISFCNKIALAGSWRMNWMGWDGSRVSWKEKALV